MSDASSAKGNNPELWQKLLTELDEKLQFGLLEKLQRISSYHFEGDVLFLEPGSPEDEQYLSKSSSFQQLQVFAQGATKVDKVKLKKSY